MAADYRQPAPLCGLSAENGPRAAGHPPVTHRLGDNGEGPAAGAHEMDCERADEAVTSRGGGADNHGIGLQFVGQPDDLGEGIAVTLDDFGADPRLRAL